MTYLRCWWQNHYVGDFFRYVGDFLNVLNRSPTSQTCHQHIWSPTSITNIDVTVLMPTVFWPPKFDGQMFDMFDNLSLKLLKYQSTIKWFTWRILLNKTNFKIWISNIMIIMSTHINRHCRSTFTVKFIIIFFGSQFVSHCTKRTIVGSKCVALLTQEFWV